MGSEEEIGKFSESLLPVLNALGVTPVLPQVYSVRAKSCPQGLGDEESLVRSRRILTGTKQMLLVAVDAFDTI